MRLWYRALLFVLLVCGLPACVWAAHGEVVNVVTAGLVEDGVTQNTRAFLALLKAHGNDTVYYFPRGTYRFNDVKVSNLANVTFYGEGADVSVWQYSSPPTSYTHTFVCTDCRQLRFHHLGFDNRHIERYGGLIFYRSSGVTFDYMKIYDSQPRVSSCCDQYGIVFGRGASISSDIVVRNSVFEGLSLEIDHAHRVLVQGNTFTDVRSTAAIGSFSITHGSEAVDFVVQENRIVNPSRCGICFNLDPPLTHNTVWKRLRILNNVLEKPVENGRYNIRLGTGNTSVRVSNTVFDEILVQGNRLYYYDVPPIQPVVKLTGYAWGGIVFTHTYLNDNAMALR